MKYFYTNKKLKLFLILKILYYIIILKLFLILLYCKLSFHTKIYYEFHLMQINLCQTFELKYDEVILNIEFITNSM